MSDQGKYACPVHGAATLHHDNRGRLRCTKRDVVRVELVVRLQKCKKLAVRMPARAMVARG